MTKILIVDDSAFCRRLMRKVVAEQMVRAVENASFAVVAPVNDHGWYRQFEKHNKRQHLKGKSARSRR